MTTELKRPKPIVGTRVLVEGHEKEGPRMIAYVLDQTYYPGGVRLDQSIDRLFIHWNVDSLIELPPEPVSLADL